VQKWHYNIDVITKHGFEYPGKILQTIKLLLGGFMEIIIHDELAKSKYVEIWLSKAENDNEDIENELKNMYDKYSNDKYRVVVFRSGTENLVKNTKELLRCNLNTARASTAPTA